MRRFFIAGLAAIGLSASTASARQPDLELSPLMIVPDSDATTGEERVAKPGDPILYTRLRYKETARLRTPRAVIVHGLYVQTGSNDELRMANVSDPSFYGLTDVSRVYCRRRFRLADSRRTQTLPVKGRSKKVRAFKSGVQLCFIDQEGSGDFTRAFVDGASHNSAKRAVAIEAVPYALETLRQPYDARVAVVVAVSPSPTETTLEVVTNLSRGLFHRSEVKYTDADGKSGNFKWGVRVSADSLPRTIRYQDAEITLISFDPGTSRLTYRSETPLSPARVKVTVLDRSERGGAFIYD